MNLKWTKDNVVSRPWIKIVVRAPRQYQGMDSTGRHFWHRSSVEPICMEIIEFLTKQEDEAWMFNPQDYLNIVQFAVERETTALMVRMITDAEVTIEKMVLRGDQIRHQKSLAGIIDPWRR